jgi:hypothetical protein
MMAGKGVLITSPLSESDQNLSAYLVKSFIDVFALSEDGERGAGMIMNDSKGAELALEGIAGAKKEVMEVLTATNHFTGALEP